MVLFFKSPRYTETISLIFPCGHVGAIRLQRPEQGAYSGCILEAPEETEYYLASSARRDKT